MPDDRHALKQDFPFDAFFVAAQEMLCTIGTDGTILWATPAWQRALGWSDAELRGQPFIDHIHPDDRADFLAGLGREPTAEEPSQFRCRARRRDGGLAWLDWRVLGSARKGVISATVRDITENRRLELHAAEIERASGIGSWELDIETEELFWSPMTRAIHEVDASFRPRLRDGIAYYAPEAHAELLPAVDALMRAGTPFDLELPFVTAKGRRRWVRSTALAEMRGDKPVRLYGTFRDITAERDRRQLLERLESVSRVTGNAVLIGDADFRLVWVNRAFEKITGYSHPEAVGRKLSELLWSDCADTTEVRPYVAMLTAGEPIRPELCYRAKGGGVRWIELDMQPLIDPAGAVSGYVGVGKDITEQKLTEARLRAAETEARLAMDRLETAVASVGNGLYIFDGEDRLVTANNSVLSNVPELNAALVPGATFEEIARVGLAQRVLTNGEGQEAEWLAKRLERHRGGPWEGEEWLRDGRCLRVIDRPMPDGGRVLFKYDITDAKRQEQRLSDIITATGAITWELNLARGELSFSDLWFRHLGYQPEDLPANGWSILDELIHPDDLGGWQDVLRRRLLGEEGDLEVDFRVRHREGHWVWLQDRGRVIRRGPDGAALSAAGTFQDITARKEVEARLRAAESDARRARADLLEAIEALADGFILFDSDDRVVLFNQRMIEIYKDNAEAFKVGASFEEMLRLAVDRGIFPAAVGREEEWITTFIAERAAHTLREEQLNDGRWFRIIDQTTASGGRIGLRIDVTELKESRRRLESIISGTKAGTWEVDLASGEMVVNDRWAEMFGYRRDEMPLNWDAFNQMIHPDDLPRVMFERNRNRKGEADAVDIELRVRHKDGHWVWIQARGGISRWLPNGAPATMAGANIDITERKRIEGEIVAARNAAEAASLAKSQFLATMSHEIRTPLNGVLGIADILHDDATDRQRPLLGIIRECGETLLEVINDILDMSKIEAGQFDLEQMPFVPTEIARKIEALHRYGAEAKGLRFTVSTEPGAALGRLGDPHRLLQILHNLVGNALKFTSQGSVVVTFGGEIHEPLVIEIQDTGIGISEEHRRRLFDKFSQADSSTSRRYGGSGLGMSIVSAFVKKMGGELDVRSELGKGTLVRISLPLPAVPVKTPPQPRGLPCLKPPPGLRVLVAEDNGVNRIILAAILAKLGAEITMTENGRAAAQAFRAGRFDLLLLDICMPGMDGIETLEAIRAHEAAFGQRPVPAIAITANSMKDQIADYLARGFSAHVSKPMEMDVLSASIVATLDRPVPMPSRPASTLRERVASS